MRYTWDLNLAKRASPTGIKITDIFNQTAMKKVILTLLCLCAIPLLAQKPEADKKFKLYEYSEAIPLYKQYLAKSPADYDATKKLALAYKYINNINGSIEAYQSLIKLRDAVPEDWCDLVQLLRISGNLTEAKVYAIQYQNKNNGEKAQNLIKSIDMYDEFMSGKNEYDIMDKTPQYQQSVYAPVFYKNGLIVTAEKSGGRLNEWTGRGFTKLFMTDAGFAQLVPFASEVMSEYTDGIATFSSDGMTMYFTTINKKSIQEQDINTRKLQISAAILKNGKWQLSDLFRFNNSSYNVAHPALRNDGRMLVFSSDKPGGKGGMDLYYCLLQPDNTWSEPVNIASINTSENEIFPTFDAENNLNFASNGLPGLGGLDIFISKNEGNSFTSPVNLKAPINSSFDDFALITNDNLGSGYFSTNRFGSPETDDIAFFSKKVAPKSVAKTIVKIYVQDKYTAIPLPYVSVAFKDDRGDDL